MQERAASVHSNVEKSNASHRNAQFEWLVSRVLIKNANQLRLHMVGILRWTDCKPAAANQLINPH